MSAEEIYKKNLTAILKQMNPCMEVLFNKDNIKEDDISFELLDTISGQKTIRIDTGSRKQLLHSLYDPVKEAKRYCKNINFNKDSLIIVFGIGLGYHILELCRNMSKNTRIIVVEHHFNLFWNALNTVDFSEPVESGKVFFTCGDMDNIKKQILYCFNYNMHYISSNIQLYHLPNLEKIDTAKNLEIMKFIRNSISNRFFSIGNVIDDSVLGLNNILENIDTIIESPTVEELSEYYKNKPAVIVSAGPSLKKNMHLLKEAQGKALILSCDASARALLDIGVKPDAILSLERVIATYNFFYKDKVYPEDVVLIGSAVLWPNIYAEYKGKKVSIQKPDKIGNWLNEYFKNSIHDIGQSVSTLSFAVAKAMGCNPIILIGQDLAYTSGKRHSDETEYQKEEEGAKADIMIEGANGEMLPSIYVFKLFRDWFERQIILFPETTVVNATEGGALIKGCKYMTFREAIDEYCTSTMDFRLNDVLKPKMLGNKEKADIISRIIEDLEERKKLFEDIGTKAKRHMKTVKDISTKYDVLTCSKDMLKTILKKLSRGDKIIQKINKSETEVSIYFGQLIAQAVVNVKRIENVLEGENVKRNMGIQYALMRYLSEVSEYLVREYEKFIEKMEKKLEVYGGEDSRTDT